MHSVQKTFADPRVNSTALRPPDRVRMVCSIAIVKTPLFLKFRLRFVRIRVGLTHRPPDSFLRFPL